MKIKSFLICSLFLAGCGVGDVNSDKSNNNNSLNLNNCVSVHTLGNVVNAAVSDASGNIATYDSNISKYCFDKTINYPIKATALNSTYIDVDYDNKKTANDIKPKFKTLESYYNFIDLITNMDAQEIDKNLSSYSSTNTTMPSGNVILNYYNNKLKDKYNITLASPSIKEKILNFVAYDYNLSNSLNFNTDLFDNYNNLSLFFSNDLNKPSIKDKVKYYSFYHSLELLDKKLIQRVDVIHKPEITYLHSTNLPVSENFVSFQNNIISKDIKIDSNENVYVASGKDGVIKLNSSLGLVSSEKVSDTFSNSYNLDIFNGDNKKYLFVADGGEGLDVFNILGGSFVYLNKILWKYYDQKSGKDVPITIDDSKGLNQIDELISVKSYVSPLAETEWLAFGTRTTGLYLVNLKKIFSTLDSNITYPIVVYNSTSDINNTLLIPGDGGEVYSEAFSSDGENLYATKGKTIERYDLSSLPVTLKGTYTINADDAYNLKMISHNGVDELFVSTNKGVELYDVQNNGDLNFISSYDTEGAQNGYLPKMSFISDKNLLLVTDGYKGLKVIKYDSSYNPELCGIGYFSPYSDKTKLAKVTSVDAYKDNTNGEYYVVVGIDGFGVAKFKLNDLLFKHCQ